MSETHGIKITKAGYGITESDIRRFILHSEYPMFKIDQVFSAQISINSGDSSGYVDITHNLGKRAFLVYQDGELLPYDIRAYNDGTKIRLTRILDAPYNQTITTYNANQIIVNNFGGLPAYDFLAGKILGSDIDSAYWFENIYVNQGQTINAANFQLKEVYTTSGNDILFKMWGIDEDNTSDLGGGYPGGRPKTDAVRTKSQSPITSHFNYGDEIKDLMQEIVNRAGWSNGNHMAFVIQNNGTPDNKGMAGDHTYSNNNVELAVTLTGTGYLTSNYKVVVFKDKIAT